MTRRTFFSFHYGRDIWRANVVRNCWLTHPNRESAGFWDASLWESTKLKGDTALQQLISSGLSNTSVTVVLIGAETASRRWVRYEIKQSYLRGNGMLGIYLHNIQVMGRRDVMGPNPFDQIWVEIQGKERVYLSSLYRVYDWIADDGYSNIGHWVDVAARAVGR